MQWPVQYRAKMGDHHEKIYLPDAWFINCADSGYIRCAERTALPTAFMFETGGYAEFTYSNRNYDVTDNMFAPTSSMYGDVSGASMSVKFDVNETVAVGIAQYNQAGISLNYQGAGSQIPGFNTAGPLVDLEIGALAVMGKYVIGDNLSVLGESKEPLSLMQLPIFLNYPEQLPPPLQLGHQKLAT